VDDAQAFRSDARKKRAQQLLAGVVPEAVRAAPMGFVFDKLKRLADQAELRERLQSIFPNLNR
jgi:hypothetical protein